MAGGYIGPGYLVHNKLRRDSKIERYTYIDSIEWISGIDVDYIRIGKGHYFQDVLLTKRAFE